MSGRDGRVVLLVGPALLTFASLIDLGLATHVFRSDDRLATALALFLFGALTGLPIQLAASRLQWFRAWDARLAAVEPDAPNEASRSRGTAALTGLLSALATMTWLYLLVSLHPALALPLANLAVVALFALDVARRRVRFGAGLLPLAVVIAGLVVAGSARAGGAQGAVIGGALLLALIARNLFQAGAEVTERAGASGHSLLAFVLRRFGWLVATGVPLALAIAFLSGRGEAVTALIQRGFWWALPFHALTMVLSLAGIMLRVKAKGLHGLTLCAAAFAAPLVLMPILALGAQVVAPAAFPTVRPAPTMFLGAAVLVSGTVWLAHAMRAGRRPSAARTDTATPTHPARLSR